MPEGSSPARTPRPLDPPRAPLAMIGGAVARALGICSAGLHQVSNDGEGIIAHWEHASVWQESDAMAPTMGQILLDVLKRAQLPPDCGCAGYTTPRLPGVVNFPDR